MLKTQTFTPTRMALIKILKNQKSKIANRKEKEVPGVDKSLPPGMNDGAAAVGNGSGSPHTVNQRISTCSSDGTPQDGRRRNENIYP